MEVLPCLCVTHRRFLSSLFAGRRVERRQLGAAPGMPNKSGAEALRLKLDIEEPRVGWSIKVWETVSIASSIPMNRSFQSSSSACPAESSTTYVSDAQSPVSCSSAFDSSAGFLYMPAVQLSRPNVSITAVVLRPPLLTFQPRPAGVPVEAGRLHTQSNSTAAVNHARCQLFLHSHNPPPTSSHACHCTTFGRAQLQASEVCLLAGAGTGAHGKALDVIASRNLMKQCVLFAG